MTPRVSIITPYRNSAAHLRDAIESLQLQSFADWEMLLVDDGSSDDGPAIAATEAESDPRLIPLSNQGKSGAAGARNYGLRNVRGQFIAFLDADDLFTPDKLASELRLMERFKTVMMTCGAALWWHPGAEHRDWVDWSRLTRGQVFGPPELLREILLLRRDQVPCTCSVLLRREVIEGLGGFEDQFELYEDQSLWAKVMLRHPVYVGHHLTSIYRQHSASTSALAEQSGSYHRTRVHPAREAFLDWIGEYVDRTGVPTRDIDQALRIARAVASKNHRGLTLSERTKVLSMISQDALGKVKARVGHHLKQRRRAELSFKN